MVSTIIDKIRYKHHLEPYLAGQRAAVVGLGNSGRAATRLLTALGAQVHVLEKDSNHVDAAFIGYAAAHGIRIITGKHTAAHFTDIDLVVISPGIHPASIVALLPPIGPSGQPIELISELELASRNICEPIIAITGTNGKTTTATLIAKFIEATGRRVFLGGNISIPLSEYVLNEDKADVLVLEVSSFQLMACTSFHPSVAVLLNFSPNHLDWHVDIEEYMTAKLKLFARQNADDLAIINTALQPLLVEKTNLIAWTLWFTAYRRFYCKYLPGKHNQANIEAAYKVARVFGLSEYKAQIALNNFHGLPHRLERVAEIGNVLFVDDSKATTVEALAAALRTFNQPIRLLAGGIFKGGNLASLVPLLQKKVFAVGLFGAGEAIFRSAWEGQVSLFWEPTLEAAVRRHWQDAKAGDVILLSPATASFDLYTDYKARGRDFARIVADLNRTSKSRERS